MLGAIPFSPPSLADTVPKIADFGLARRVDTGGGMTATGAVLGTPSYMAPEQARGSTKEIGPACDLYALGAILYECLTGRPPFRAATAMDTMMQVIHDEPVAVRSLQPKVPRDLETVCHKAMHKESGRRYGSAADLADDLGRFLDGVPVKARPVGRTERLARWCRRRPAVAFLITLSAVLGLVGAGGVLWQWRQARLEGARAEESFRRSRMAIDDLFTLVSEEELLNQPGMTPLRERLLRRALKYYQEFTAQRSNDPALRHELAAAFYRVGRIAEELNTPSDALAAYQEARTLQEQLTAEHPNQSDYRRDLAHTCTSLGQVQQRVGDTTAALDTLHRARDLAEALAEASPQDLNYRMQQARAYSSLARLYRPLGKSKEADRMGNRAVEVLEPAADVPAAWAPLAAACEAQAFTQPFAKAQQTRSRAITLRERLVRERPSDTGRQQSLAAAYFARAVDERDRGDRRQSIDRFKEALRLQEKLHEREPDVPQLQRDLGSTCDQMAYALSQIGQPQEALPLYERALGLYRTLVKGNPRDVGARNFEAMILNGIALVYRDLNRPDDSRKTFEQALAIYARLVDEFPTDGGHRMDWAGTHYNLARMHSRFKEQPAALTRFRQAHAIWSEMAAADPGSIRLPDLMTMAEVEIGGALLEMGESAEAVRVLRDCRDRARSLVERDRVNLHYRRLRDQSLLLLAAGYRALGRPTEAAETALDRTEEDADDPEWVVSVAGDLAQALALLRAKEIEPLDALTGMLAAGARSDAAAPWMMGFPAARLADGDRPPADLPQRVVARALALLRKAVAAGRLDAERLNKAEPLAPLRQLPEFDQLLKRKEPNG